MLCKVASKNCHLTIVGSLVSKRQPLEEWAKYAFRAIAHQAN